jgi:small conductance mechanosensitive channel
VGSISSVTLNVLLVVGILGYFGIQTTTFAALVAAAGVAIGMAWAGLLSNFAADAFLIVLRPFKVGDFISAGGVTGTVREIGLFTTAIDTPDNVMTIVGNGKVFSDTIQKFSTNPFRRVDLEIQLAGAADCHAVMKLLRKQVGTVVNVLNSPPVDVEILTGALTDKPKRTRTTQRCTTVRNPNGCSMRVPFSASAVTTLPLTS